MSIDEIFTTLQIQQEIHNDLFHKEVTSLNIHHRLNHMVLHFVKYAGRICDSVLNFKDELSLNKNVIDSFIIATTCANILNIQIADKLELSEAESLFDLGNSIASRLSIDTSDSFWLVKTYPIVVGELAKACESIDHLEPYPYREKIAECVIQIFSLMLIAASQSNIDLITEVSNRLTGVKKKSIFFKEFTVT